jgi:hypothetical protein
MAAMDDLRKAANAHAQEKLSEFLRFFTADVLAVMLVDFETAVTGAIEDSRHLAIIDAGFDKVGGKKFVEMVKARREAVQ